MKRVSFGVALVVSALVIGCQDSSNNNPISSDNLPSTVKRSSSSHAPAYSGVIKLKEIVNNGGSVDRVEEFAVNGSIAYTIDPAAPDQEKVFTLTLVSVLTVQSTGDNKDSYSAYDEGVQDIQMTDGVQKVFRSIALYSAERPMRLFLEFDVDTESVTLVSLQITDDAFLDRN